MPKLNLNSTITVQDPAIITRKRVYPEVLLRNRKTDQSVSTIKSKDAVYFTDEFESTKNQYVEIFTGNIVVPSGNTGSIQFNNVTFSSDANLTWQNNNLLNVIGDVNITNSFNTDIIKSTNVKFKVNSYNWEFDSSGELHLPNYTLPGTDGEDSQTLISDGTGNLIWETLSSSYDSVVQLANSTGTVIHNFNSGQVFYHTNIQSNFTANIINFNLQNNAGTNINLVLVQGTNPFICNAVQIDGVSQVINWVGGIVPTPNKDMIEILTFSITRINLVYTVYAQLLIFG